MKNLDVCPKGVFFVGQRVRNVKGSESVVISVDSIKSKLPGVEVRYPDGGTGWMSFKEDCEGYSAYIWYTPVDKIEDQLNFEDYLWE